MKFSPSYVYSLAKADGLRVRDVARHFVAQAVADIPFHCRDRVVLDVACGREQIFFASRMKESTKIIGIDIDTDSLANNRFVHHPVCADIQAFPLCANSVDVIVSVDTIEHCYVPELFLAECYRVLRPGGIAVFTTPHLFGYKTLIARYGGKRVFDFIWRALKNTTLPYDSLYRMNTGRKWRGAARKIGFSVCRIEYIPEITHFFFPYPLLCAAARTWDVFWESLGMKILFNYMVVALEKTAPVSPDRGK